MLMVGDSLAPNTLTVIVVFISFLACSTIRTVTCFPLFTHRNRTLLTLMIFCKKNPLMMNLLLPDAFLINSP
jgi:hypothetical protein